MKPEPLDYAPVPRKKREWSPWYAWLPAILTCAIPLTILVIFLIIFAAATPQFMAIAIVFLALAVAAVVAFVRKI